MSAKPRPGIRVVSVPYWHALSPTHPLALPNTTSFYFWPKAKGLAIGTLHFTMQDGQQLHLVLRATSARPRLEIANETTVGPLKYVLRPLRITFFVYNNNDCAFQSYQRNSMVGYRITFTLECEVVWHAHLIAQLIAFYQMLLIHQQKFVLFMQSL